MHQWDTPTVRIGSLPSVVEGVKVLLDKFGVEKSEDWPGKKQS